MYVRTCIWSGLIHQSAADQWSSRTLRCCVTRQCLTAVWWKLIVASFCVLQCHLAVNKLCFGVHKGEVRKSYASDVIGLSHLLSWVCRITVLFVMWLSCACLVSYVQHHLNLYPSMTCLPTVLWPSGSEWSWQDNHIQDIDGRPRPLIRHCLCQELWCCPPKVSCEG